MMNLPSNDAIIKELCEKSFKEFVKYSWRINEPMTPLIDNWHIGAQCEYLEAVEAGQIKRLLINEPPRALKSQIVTVAWPAWVWIRKNYKRFANMSYAASLSMEHALKRRDIIQSYWYQNNWGDKVTLKEDKNTVKDYWNTAQGQMYATSVGGTITGKGYDYLIFDDPHNPTQTESDKQREDAIDYFRGTIQTRLNDPVNGAIIVVMQRLHPQDLSGFILSRDLGYEHLCIPMTPKKQIMIDLPMSGGKIIREPGELMFPQRFPQTILDGYKKNMGSAKYNAQMDQDPTEAGGGMYKKWWWRYWKPRGMELPPVQVDMIDEDNRAHTLYIDAVELPAEFDEKLQSWDAAFKKKEDSDFVAGHIWGKKGANRYLITRDTKRRSFTETLSAIRAMSSQFDDVGKKLIEDKANGPAIIDVLKSEIQGIIPINPGTDSKSTRAESQTFQIEAGNVYLPHPLIADWVDEFIENCAKFPKVEHDDDIDAMTQALIYWNKKKKFNYAVI